MIGHGVADPAADEKGRGQATDADPPAASLGPSHDGPQFICTGLRLIIFICGTQ